MFWAVCTGNDNYNFHHSDVATAWHIIDGLIANGQQGTVLWGGGDATVRGVPHANLLTAAPAPDDVLIIVGPYWANAIRTDPRYSKLLVANERWWYPYDYSGGPQGGFWKHIFIEGQDWLNEIRARTPDAAIHWCMMGCQDSIEIPPAPPDYNNGKKNIFYAGRLSAVDVNKPPLLHIRNLAKELGSSYHIWMASGSIYIPQPNVLPPPHGLNVHQDTVGRVVHIPLAGVPWGFKPDAVDPKPIGWKVVTQAEMWGHIDTAVPYIEGLIGRSNVSFLGPMIYGAFWHWFFHAHCALDFGHEHTPHAPNCKIVDPMRCGCPVVTDGKSQSYILIDKHGGRRVPWRDVEAEAEAIRSLPPRDGGQRLFAAAAFCSAESWHARARQMLLDTERA